MKKLQLSEAQIVKILGQAEGSEMTVSEVCRLSAISENTFYRWRNATATCRSQRSSAARAGSRKRPPQAPAGRARLRTRRHPRDLTGKMSGAPARRGGARTDRRRSKRGRRLPRPGDLALLVSLRLAPARRDRVDRGYQGDPRRKRRWGYKRVHKRLCKDGYVVNRNASNASA